MSIIRSFFYSAHFFTVFQVDYPQKKITHSEKDRTLAVSISLIFRELCLRCGSSYEQRNLRNPLTHEAARIPAPQI